MNIKVLKLTNVLKTSAQDIENKIKEEESVLDCSVIENDGEFYLNYALKNKYDEYGSMISIINSLYDNFNIDADMIGGQQEDKNEDIIVDFNNDIEPIKEDDIEDDESLEECEEDEEKLEKKKKFGKILELGASLLIFIIGLILSQFSSTKEFSRYVQVIAFAVAGYEIIFSGISKIFKGKVFTEELLMTLASFSAILLGHVSEAVGIMFLYCVGEFFQDSVSDSVKKALNDLKKLTPQEVTVKGEGDKELKVKYQDVKVGDILIVKAGERIVFDGKIISGSSSVDTKAVTGESLPKDLIKGDKVYGGFLCINGVLEIEVEKDYQNSTLAKISEYVEISANKKSKKQSIMEKFASFYTPIITIIAVLLAFIPPIFYETYTDGLYVWGVRAVMLLCISCPCSMLVSVPLTYYCGVGNATKKGVLIKSSLTLEQLSDCKVFVFDKTGTLTKGELKIEKIISTKKYANKVLEYATIVEKFSNHPIATCINKLQKSQEVGENYVEYAGKGVSCIYNGQEIVAGNKYLMQEKNVSFKEIENLGAKLYLAVDGEFAGAIVLKDTVKDEAKGAINELYDAGVLDTVMLTGDNKDYAKSIRKELNMKKSVSELTPDKKVEELENVIKENDNSFVAFVGDGINDAPALKRADVGIAMGGVGSDIAVESSDVVILNDDLSNVPYTVFLAKRTNGIAKQNIIAPLAVKLAVLLLSVFGITDSLWLAIGADVGMLILTVLNAVRNKFDV